MRHFKLKNIIFVIAVVLSIFTLDGCRREEPAPLKVFGY